MPLRKKVKDQTEETWKSLISDDLLNRIRNIVEQTGTPPPDLFLKWILQEEAFIGLMQRNKGQIAEQTETRQDVVPQKTPAASKKYAAGASLNPSSPNYRKTLVKRARNLKKEGMTLKKIAETFNDEKVLTFSGTGKWYASSINNLLKSK
jgi:hypothetical protein